MAGSGPASPTAAHRPPRRGATVLAVVIGLAVVVGGVLLQDGGELTIIVVSMDTTRADHLTPYGYDRDTTPTLSRLAAEGTRFSQARSTTSWTLPSHMSLFTGLPPALHQVRIDFEQLDAGRPTLGTIFHDAGFLTVGLFTAPYVHSRFGFGQGFDFYESMTQNPMVFDLPPAAMAKQSGLREMFSHQEVTSPQLFDRARWFLTQRRQPRSLVFLHAFDPHYDYRAPPRIRGLFTDRDYHGPIVGDEIMGQIPTIEAGDPADLAQLKGLYDADIRFTDDHLGEVIRAVETQGLLGRVIVVVVSDHGEEFLDDGRFGHRMTLRDEVLRVPMIFWGPGLIPEGRVIDDEVALYDVLPTLMDYADIDPDPMIWGRSLRPLIEGEGLPPRPTAAALTFLHREGPDYFTQHDAVVYQGIKAIRRVRVPWSRFEERNIDNPPDWRTVEFDVFDLREDPGETHDLHDATPDDPRVVAALEALDQHQREVAAARSAYIEQGTGHLGVDALSGSDVMTMITELGYAGMVRDESEAGASGGER